MLESMYKYGWQAVRLCSWEGPEDTQFTKAIRNVLARRATASVNSRLVFFLFRPEMIVEEAIEKLDSLIAKKVT